MPANAMAAIGERESVMAFMALGVRVYPVETKEEAQRALFDAAKSGASVILITEEMADKIPEAISRYQTDPVPAIIPIPGASGGTGRGMAGVRANVEKAVGADILFKEEK